MIVGAKILLFRDVAYVQHRQRKAWVKYKSLIQVVMSRKSWLAICQPRNLVGYKIVSEIGSDFCYCGSLGCTVALWSHSELSFGGISGCWCCKWARAHSDLRILLGEREEACDWFRCKYLQVNLYALSFIRLRIINLVLFFQETSELRIPLIKGLLVLSDLLSEKFLNFWSAVYFLVDRLNFLVL